MSKLEVLVAPRTAEILIDGQKYTNGDFYLPPGEYNVKISKEGFETYDGLLNLEKAKAQYSLEVVLVQKDGDDWFLNNKEDDYIQTMIGDRVADREQQEYASRDKILEITPFTNDSVDFTVYAESESPDSKIKLTVFFNTCSNSTATIVKYKEKVEKWLKDQKLDISRYDVVRYGLCQDEIVSW